MMNVVWFIGQPCENQFPSNCRSLNLAACQKPALVALLALKLNVSKLNLSKPAFALPFSCFKLMVSPSLKPSQFVTLSSLSTPCSQSNQIILLPKCLLDLPLLHHHSPCPESVAVLSCQDFLIFHSFFPNLPWIVSNLLLYNKRSGLNANLSITTLC